MLKLYDLKITVVNIVIVFLIGGCATGAKNPNSANTFEILFGNNVQNYISRKKIELKQLNTRTSQLDAEIISSLGRIHRIEKKLKYNQSKTLRSSQQLQNLRMEINQQKEKAESSLQRVAELKSQILFLESDFDNIHKNITQIENLKKEVSQLEEENVVLNRAIERNLNLKAEQLFRNDAEM